MSLILRWPTGFQASDRSERTTPQKPAQKQIVLSNSRSLHRHPTRRASLVEISNSIRLLMDCLSLVGALIFVPK